MLVSNNFPEHFANIQKQGRVVEKQIVCTF